MIGHPTLHGLYPCMRTKQWLKFLRIKIWNGNGNRSFTANVLSQGRVMEPTRLKLHQQFRIEGATRVCTQNDCSLHEVKHFMTMHSHWNVDESVERELLVDGVIAETAFDQRLSVTRSRNPNKAMPLAESPAQYQSMRNRTTPMRLSFHERLYDYWRRSILAMSPQLVGLAVLLWRQQCSLCWPLLSSVFTSNNNYLMTPCQQSTKQCNAAHCLSCRKSNHGVFTEVLFNSDGII
jgi:hypothetical protein